MDYLDSLPVGAQAILVAIIFAGLSIIGLYIVRRLVSLKTLQEHHDVAGFTFGVIGAFYGVVLAFVIVAVWQRFETANQKTEVEALALSNLYNLSEGFSQPTRGELRAALHGYVSRVLNSEWKQMADYDYKETIAPEKRLWRILGDYHPATPQQQTFLDKSVNQMAILSDARQSRYMYYSEDLPSVVWIVIYVGCVITIGFSYFFGTRVFGSQAIMVGIFSALIGLTILAISELATPFQGEVVISNAPFRAVLASMDSGISAPTAAQAEARIKKPPAIRKDSSQ